MLEMKDIVSSMRRLLLPEYEKGTEMTVNQNPMDDEMNASRNERQNGKKLNKRLNKHKKSTKGKLKNERFKK